MNTRYSTSDFSRQNIKRRLRKTAADLWGFQEADMDGFDPIVDLLLGACSVEFEKTAQEIFSAQTRIMEQLAHLLLPEVLTVPQPAHAVLHARAVEPRYTLQKEDQVYYEKEVLARADTGKVATKAVYFSPAASLTLCRGDVKYLACNNRLMQTPNAVSKDSLLMAPLGHALAAHVLWIGLELHPKVTSLEGLSFFFDWKNHPEKAEYAQWLALSQWSVADTPLQATHGYGQTYAAAVQEKNQEVAASLDHIREIEARVSTIYHHHFITLESPVKDWFSQVSPYPAAFEKVFSEGDLSQLKTPVLWLKVQFPPVFPAAAIEDAYCAVNCFPVLNRRLMDSRRPYRLEKSFNILPLETEDYFLGMRRLYSDTQVYQAVPFRGHREQHPETYTLRQGGIGRFDSRHAAALLDYVINVMRDESAAFSALGGATLSRDVKELDQTLNRLEANLTRKAPDQDVTHYLIVKPKTAQDVWVSYWTTLGTLGNQIPAGSALKTDGMDLQKDTVQLATTTNGGQDKPDDTERLYAFKNALLSRNRLLTAEDIRAACFAYLGHKVRQVTVQRGVAVDTHPKRALMRTVEVVLTPAHPTTASDAWDPLCDELQRVLEERTEVFLPIRVKLSTDHTTKQQQHDDKK